MLSVPCIWRRASASWPHPLSERGINYVYLSTYFSQTSSVTWHWLAGVFCLSPSQSWPTIETRSPVQDAACGTKKNSQNSLCQQTFQQLFPLLLSPCVDRISGPSVHDHKKVQIFCWSGVENYSSDRRPAVIPMWGENNLTANTCMLCHCRNSTFKH